MRDSAHERYRRVWAVFLLKLKNFIKSLKKSVKIGLIIQKNSENSTDSSKIIKKALIVEKNRFPGRGSNPRRLNAVPCSSDAGSIPARETNFFRH